MTVKLAFGEYFLLVLISIIMVFCHGSNMMVSPDHRSLYVASDWRVVQFSVASCLRYATHCAQCTRDPFCVWNRQKATCQDITEVSG